MNILEKFIFLVWQHSFSSTNIFNLEFREFDPKTKMVIEGQDASMTIYCVPPGQCNHAKVSWSTRFHHTNIEYKIPYPITDPHYRLEDYENFHRLWINKVGLTDIGTFTVEKEEDIKQCDLCVIGKMKNER